MKQHVFTNGQLRIVVQEDQAQESWSFFVAAIEMSSPSGWRTLATGIEGQEFSTSHGGTNASTFEAVQADDCSWQLRLSATAQGWDASEVIRLDPDHAILYREQTYRFHTSCDGAVHPAWHVADNERLRYTFALRAHESRMAGLPQLRSDVAWALPFPFHVWHDDDYVALYGLDKRTSKGTLDFAPPGPEGRARLGVYYPDTTEQAAGFFGEPRIPQFTHFEAGEQVTLHEVFAAQRLQPGQEPLLVAERIAADILLDQPWPQSNLGAVADGIANFYPHCELWEADAFGPGRGWFLNMWVYTQQGRPERKGPGGGYFDLGWGEGIAAEIFVALVRHWKRSGRTDLLAYVDEMTRSLHLFKRGPGPSEPYFDRSDGRRFGDFMLNHTPPGRRVWSHSLGHTGSQLLQAYIEAPSYPDPQVPQEWLAAATSIADFFAKNQRANGDIQDIFDDEDKELNTKPHRIAARAVVCGLWSRMAEVAGDQFYVERALRLARAVAPEIEAYAFYNQMIDGLESPVIEFIDGESAYYVLEGLAPLYAATRDPSVLSLCQKAAAFGIAWTYFFDLPHAHHGIARGGQCCRMPDFPLLYPIGPAKAIEPLLSLYKSTDDPFYERMAEEMVRFIAEYQWDCPGKPWHGGMIHAIEQCTGKHWGPDKRGQVDSGMATGNSLASIELWLAHTQSR